MKDYYKVLGVTRHTPDAEIKKAYRKLVLKYHPDRNPDPLAKLIIQDLNIAYDVLGDTQKRAAYNYKYDNQGGSASRQKPVTNNKTTYKRQPYTAPQKKYKKKVKDYSAYTKKGKLISMFVLSYAILLCLDFIISNHYENTVVENVETIAHTSHSRRGGSTTDYNTYKVASSRVNFSVSSSAGAVHINDTLNVNITPIFGIVKNISRINDENFYVVPISVYDPFWFVLFLVLGCSWAALKVKSGDTSLNFSIFSFLLFFCLLYLVNI